MKWYSYSYSIFASADWITSTSAVRQGGLSMGTKREVGRMTFLDFLPQNNFGCSAIEC